MSDVPGAFAAMALQQQQPLDNAVDASSRPEDLSCPCCYRPGKLCDSFSPEEAPMKIRGLRVLMASHGLDAYIVPSGDAHSSEYVAPCDERRAWLTGFTGSAGTAIVSLKGAALWTDGRYFNQASTQLEGSPFTLMRQHEPNVPDMPEWCLQQGTKIGICGSLCTIQFSNNFREKGLELVPIATDFVDVIWGSRRPKVPRNPCLEQPLALTGESVKSKLERVKKELNGNALVLNALDQICWLTNLRGNDVECNPVFFAYAVVTDELTLYLRCLDRELCGNGLEQHESDERIAILKATLQNHFRSEGVAVNLLPYSSFDAAECAKRCAGRKVALEKATSTLAMAAAIPEDRRILVDCSPVEIFKAVKNDVEIAGLRKAGRRDCAALCGFYGWLETRLGRVGDGVQISGAFSTTSKVCVGRVDGVWDVSDSLERPSGPTAAERARGSSSERPPDAIDATRRRRLAPSTRRCYHDWSMSAQVDECQACDEIMRRRRMMGGPLYKGDSFDTISSVGANASIIHYKPTPNECATITSTEVYLCDTGGQYGDGTTDITRTNHFGKPSEDERRCYTRVLQGHVGMARAIFPEGTPGVMFDALARAPLWRDGLNYLHGTGHGMGSYLNVHEGPFGVGGGAVTADKQFASHAAKLRYLNEIRRGHYVSDEPGFYQDGSFGFRIESDLVAVVAETKYAYGTRAWLKFEYLTPLPFSRSLTDASLLLEDEVRWIDAFHQECWATVAPLLTAQSLDDAADAARARQWLWRETRPLQEEACPPVPPPIDPAKCHSILDF